VRRGSLAPFSPARSSQLALSPCFTPPRPEQAGHPSACSGSSPVHQSNTDATCGHCGSLGRPFSHALGGSVGPSLARSAPRVFLHRYVAKTRNVFPRWTKCPPQGPAENRRIAQQGRRRESQSRAQTARPHHSEMPIRGAVKEHDASRVFPGVPKSKNPCGRLPATASGHGACSPPFGRA